MKNVKFINVSIFEIIIVTKNVNFNYLHVFGDLILHVILDVYTNIYWGILVIMGPRSDFQLKKQLFSNKMMKKKSNFFLFFDFSIRFWHVYSRLSKRWLVYKFFLDTIITFFFRAENRFLGFFFIRLKLKISQELKQIFGNYFSIW